MAADGRAGEPGSARTDCIADSCPNGQGRCAKCRAKQREAQPSSGGAVRYQDRRDSGALIDQKLQEKSTIGEGWFPETTTTMCAHEGKGCNNGATRVRFGEFRCATAIRQTGTGSCLHTTFTMQRTAYNAQHDNAQHSNIPSRSTDRDRLSRLHHHGTARTDDIT